MYIYIYIYIYIYTCILRYAGAGCAPQSCGGGFPGSRLSSPGEGSPLFRGPLTIRLYVLI